MTVTVSGTVTDATGRKDSRPWKVWSDSYRAGPDGGVITTRPQAVHLSEGVFTAELEPGAMVFEDPDGRRWDVIIPDDDADLWDVLGEAGS